MPWRSDRLTVLKRVGFLPLKVPCLYCSLPHVQASPALCIAPCDWADNLLVLLWLLKSLVSTYEFNVLCQHPGNCGKLICWLANRVKVETVADLIFLGSKITADGDCSHDIERHLLLRKTTTNLDSVLKSREITLLTKIRIVKAMVFPVRMAEHWRIDAFKLWWLEKTLESPMYYTEIKSVNPKGNKSWIFIRRTVAEAELPNCGLLMWRPESLEKTLLLGKIEGKRRRIWQRKRGLNGISNSMDMSLSKLWETVKDQEAWHVVVHAVPKSWTGLKRLSSSSSTKELMLLSCGSGEDSRIPWTSGRSNQSILKEINPEYSWEGLMLKLLYFGHLIQRANSLEKTLILGKIEGSGEGGNRQWDG